MRKAITLILVISLFIMLPVIMYAGGPPPPPPKGKTPSIPIDGGIGILILAGIAYGSKKIYDLGRKNKQ